MTEISNSDLSRIIEAMQKIDLSISESVKYINAIKRNIPSKADELRLIFKGKTLFIKFEGYRLIRLEIKEGDWKT